MAFDPHNNFGYSTVLSVVSQSGGVLIFIVPTGQGARFTVGQNLTIWPASPAIPLSTTAMIVRITAKTGDQITASYAQESSVTITVAPGMQVMNGITAKVLTDIEALFPAGSVVGTTDSQTLTNKTLTSPVLNTGVSGTAIDTDGTLAANSDTKLATQKAVKTYVTAQIGTDGWITDTHTWVYASASSFTIAGVNLTAVFTKGTRIKWKEGATQKYGVVISSSFSTNTTVNIAPNTDYVITNTVLSSPAYSYAVNPQGYPGFFTYTPVFSGFSADPTVSMSRFSIIGNKCSVFHSESAAGTSNTTGFAITLPVNSANIASAEWTSTPPQVKDNGVNLAAPALIIVGGNSATATLYSSYTVGSVWTASGAKQAYRFGIDYEI